MKFFRLNLRNSQRKLRSAAVAAATVGLVLATASPGNAAYDYNVGHRLNISNTAECTGSYAITGTSGTFVLTAGHCGWVGQPVYNSGYAYIGTFAHEKTTDSALVDVDPNKMYQIIVDPVSGRKPAGDGRVEGVMPTSQQTYGTLLGKMGRTTGWQEGRITGTMSWYGQTAICFSAHTLPGDSGGPVWRSDSAGLRAVGMTVAYRAGGGEGCYIPIQQLLNDWGAWMNVFSTSAAAAASSGSSSVPAGLPVLDPADYLPAVGSK